MPQEFIIWQTEAGWFGRYEAKTQGGSSVGVTGPHRSAAHAAEAITADGMGSGGQITAGTFSYRYEGGGGGGGGRVMPNEPMYWVNPNTYAGGYDGPGSGDSGETASITLAPSGGSGSD